MSSSGLRTWTKQEETKESTNPSSLNLRIRYAFSSRPSLLTTAIFSRGSVVSPMWLRGRHEDQQPARRTEEATAAALRVKVYAGRRSGRVAPGRRAAGLKELARCLRHRIVIVTTPRRTRTMNTTIITSQRLLLIQSPPPRVLTRSATTFNGLLGC
jgi:hypothetical protein